MNKPYFGDEPLFHEFALRRSDLSKLRDPDETQIPAGEIVKISEFTAERHRLQVNQ